jgi:hypothetical protein
VDTARESRRLNPRALAAATVHPGLASAVGRLDRALAAQRILVVAIGRRAGADSAAGPSEAELRRAFAVALDDVAHCLRAFGDLVQAEYGRVRTDRADEAFERTLDAVQEARAVLAELTLLDVGPRGGTELWLLHGSVLTAIEQVVAQLDVEHAVRSTEPWLDRRALPVLGKPLRARRREPRKPR